jgi:hypothetical protein
MNYPVWDVTFGRAVDRNRVDSPRLCRTLPPASPWATRYASAPRGTTVRRWGAQTLEVEVAVRR